MQESRRRSPIVARRRLGAELERLRGRRTQPAAATLLGMSVGKLKYLEWGTRAMSLADLNEKVLPGYQVPESEHKALIELCEQANERAWWDDYGDEDLAAEDKRFLGLEYGATRIRDYHQLLFPGLLQTHGYAEAVLRLAWAQPAEQAAALVKTRQHRQRVLFEPDPLQLSVILDEAILHRQVGDQTVMEEQFHHVADLAEARPNVTVQIIPLEAGAHPGLFGSFWLLEFGWPDDAGLVHMEPGPDRLLALDNRRDVYRYSGIFDRLLQVALPPAESVAMLRKASPDRKRSRHA